MGNRNEIRRGDGNGKCRGQVDENVKGGNENKNKERIRLREMGDGRRTVNGKMVKMKWETSWNMKRILHVGWEWEEKIIKR